VIDDPGWGSRPKIAAGALFFDGDGRIMLVQPTYKDYFDIPGGYIEMGETRAKLPAVRSRKNSD
jgi:ADP-ribose pyrophosphatase YjhB (NUDIX family)